jgi:hypothetical protein
LADSSTNSFFAEVLFVDCMVKFPFVIAPPL